MDGLAVYEDTLTKMRSILKNIQNAPVLQTKKQFENLRLQLAKDIHRLKPGALEEHLQKRELAKQI